MDVSPTALLRNFVPRIPSILYTSIAALLGKTPNSTDQDAVTQIIVAAARPILRTPASIARSQRVWNRLGRWVGKGMDVMQWVGLGWIMGLDGVEVGKQAIEADGIDRVSEKEEEGVKVVSVREAVAFAFDVLRDPKHGSISCSIPKVVDVEVEWTTPRSRDPGEPQVCRHSGGQEKQQQQRVGISSGAPTSRPVILYLHGGAHCLMDPTTHRWTTGTLSKLSGADTCTVRFRLSPQHPFPAALLDAFVTYLSLLDPSPSSSRSPITSDRIVLAGDSSGGGLAASLLLLLVTLSRNNISITHHGRSIHIPFPPCAGLALTSPWLDITRSLPSTSANEKWDIIAPPPIDSASPPFPPDELWPTHPPRAETYCAADICTHPLVSPLAASSVQWVGPPPVWVCSGWEGFTDEIEVFARRVFMSGKDAIVLFEGWNGMPHCFGMMPWGRQGWEAMFEWARFCADAVTKSVRRRGDGVWRGKNGERRIRMDELGLEREDVGYQRQTVLTDKVVDEMMEKSRIWRMDLEDNMLRSEKANVDRFVP